jgi:hypothetical protein
MTENLAKYISLALRKGENGQSLIDSMGLKEVPNHQLTDLHQSQFLIDGRFSLRLDEVV